MSRFVYGKKYGNNNNNILTFNKIETELQNAVYIFHIIGQNEQISLRT